MLSWLLEWVNDEKLFIFLMVILNITASRVTFTYLFRSKYDFISELLILGCDVALISLFAALIDILLYICLKSFVKLHTSIKFILLFVSACMFTADLFSLYYFNIPVNIAMINIILNTNFRETGEFIQVYLANINLWGYFFIIIVAALSCVKLLMKSVKIFPVLIILCVTFGIFAAVREYNRGRGFGRLTNSLAPVRIFNMLSSSYASVKSWNEMLKEVPLDIVLTKNESSIPNVVFILGESTTRNHMEIYGYELPNTPKLREREANGELYVFTDTISAAPGTMASLQRLFTFYRNDSEKEWFKYINLFSILKSAGYYTIWMSNQESFAVGGQHPAGFYSSRCDERYFTEILKDSGYKGEAKDEMLLPFLDNALKNEHEKNFYLLHLMGTHFHYHKRYTEKFEKFTAEDEGGFEGINTVQKNIRAKYDNAILYNDFVVDEIIKRFEDKNAIVIYVPDHGEEVYDTRNFQGHFEGIKTCVEIPFIIWLSEKFRAKYPELEARISQSIDRPYMTDDIIHTILDIMSIETPEYDPSRSIINPSFDIARPRIYSEHVYTKDGGLQ